MPKYSTINLDIDKRDVARLELDRPDKHHAFNAEMIAEMADAAASLRDDDRARVVLITSEGPSFCAGGDLEWMKAQHEAGRKGKIAEASKLAAMLKSLHDLPKPVIARVQGQAYGGGIGLMAVADIVIAVDSARFALTETRLGLIPATIGPFVVAKMGGAAARSVFVTGSAMSAARAAELGLVSRVVADDKLDDAVAGEIKAALAAAPGAMGRAKEMLRRITAPDLDSQIEIAIEQLADCWESDEAKAGIKAFFDKAPAPWVKD